MDKKSDIAAQVAARAAELTDDAHGPSEPLDQEFVKKCLNSNERGDGCMYAALHRMSYLYNTTPRDGEWYIWTGHVWQRDDFRRALDAVENCALEYQQQAELLTKDIKENGIDKKHEDAWKISVRDKYRSRADRLRSATGAAKVLHWAPVVEPAMACRESDFDKQPDLLPVKNGVVDLRTGVLTRGKPEDMLTRVLDVEYDPHADYTDWVKFIEEISDSEDVAAFVKRSLGYAITGHSYEQYIWVFTGSGRNGKGVLFDLVGDVMRPYYHVISRAMLIEQRNEPSPSAASEHKYSLLGKRIIVGAETNRGQKIDAGAVKGLTGDDDINCRPNFSSEITFKPSHTLLLHTNHVPVGLTRDFALVQRLIKIEFPYMYVDDPEAEEKKQPARAGKFKKKDPTLKDKFRQMKQGILRWLVEGAKEWHEQGLSPPDSIIESVQNLAKEEDYVGRFIETCMVGQGNDQEIRVRCTEMYDAFRWWWSENMDETEKRIPAMKTINKELREKGIVVEETGGKTWIYGYTVNTDILEEVQAFMSKKGG